MERIILMSALLIFPSTASLATSYASPRKKTLYSADKKFHVTINPATGTHRVFKKKTPVKPIWIFTKKAWHAIRLISKDGKKNFLSVRDGSMKIR